MSDVADAWTATISVRTPSADLSGWLERALQPEMAREVPRARARLQRVDDRCMEVVIAARDTGALRASLNTYLGWVHLALAALPPTGASAD